MAKFEKGQSGNPEGRPRGSQNRATKLRALLEPHASALVKKAVALAKGGDVQALRLCLERLIPPMKAEARPVSLPALRGISALSEQGRAILDAVAAGTIGPDQAGTLMAAVAAQARIVEVDELVKRVEALEASHAQKS